MPSSPGDVRERSVEHAHEGILATVLLQVRYNYPIASQAKTTCTSGRPVLPTMVATDVSATLTPTSAPLSRLALFYDHSLTPWRAPKDRRANVPPPDQQSPPAASFKRTGRN